VRNWLQKSRFATAVRTLTHRLGSFKLLFGWTIPNQFTGSGDDVVERVTTVLRRLGLLVLADELDNLVLLDQHFTPCLSYSHLFDHVGEYGCRALRVPSKRSCLITL